MKKLFTLLIVLFLWAGFASAQFVVIGTGTGTTNSSTADPVERYYNYEHYQIVYTAAELTAAGMPSGSIITALGFSISESAVSLANYSISLGHTSQAIASPYISTGLTVVKNPFTYAPVVQAAGSFDMITFDAPFTWDGTSNIVVNTCTGSNGYISPYGGLRYTAGTSGIMRYNRVDGSSNCATATSTNSSNKPNIRFNYTGSTPCSGTPSPGNTLASINPICSGASFALSLQNATTGTGVAYQWQSSPNESTWTNFGTSSASQVVSQTAATYYQCIVTCSGSSGTSTAVLVAMNPYKNCYCYPVTTYGCNDGDVIARVKLSSLDNNSGTGCPSGTLGYSDYTDYSTHPEWTTALMPSSTYACTVWAGQYGEGYAAWIDYNDDGTFDNSTERIGYSNGQVAGSGVVGQLGSSASFPIVLACSPPAGEHRLRVRAMYNVNGNAVTPCTNNSYGEVEDYLVTITGAPSCAAPGTIDSTTATTSSVTLNITMNCATATTFDFEYGPVGFTQGAGTLLTAQTVSVNAGIASYTLTGLNPSTGYDVYYSANCGASGTSTWAGPNTVVTAFECLGGYYTEAEACGTDGNGGCNMTTPAWEPLTPGQTICGTAWCNGTNRDTDWYTFTLTEMQNVTITVKAQFGVLFGFIAAPCPNTTFVAGGAGTVAAGVEGTITVALAAGTYYALAAPSDFTTIITCGNADAYHLTVTTAGGCFAPTALLAVPGETSALIDWTDNTSATEWEVEYGAAGFAQGTGTTVVVSSKPYTITPLTANTNYAYYVRAKCDATTYSSWAGPKTFTTLCSASTSLNENFDAVTAPAFPGCWTKVGVTGSAYTQASSPNSSPNCLYIYSGAVVSLPALSNAGANTHQLKFNLRANFTVDGILEVGYLTDPNNIASFVSVQSVTATSLTYTESIVMLGTAPGAYQVLAFRASTSPANSMLIDDVIWEPLPTCLKPTTLLVTPSSTSAEIDWTETGTATNWIVEYGPQGFALGAGTSIPVSTKPYTLTPLSVSTNYSYYVRAVCSISDSSSWSSVKNFATTQIPAALPFTEGFETGFGDWSVVNGAQTNQWFAGTATAYSGAQSAYISDDAGVTNNFNIDVASVVHIYRDITFPAGADGYALSFWYKAVGEVCCDYLKVFLVDPATTPVAGTVLSSGQIGGTYNDTSAYIKEFVGLPSSLGGTTKRLVFTWKNDGSIGVQPPVSLDDILLQTATYATVTTDVASAITSTTATCGGNVTTEGNLPVTVRGVCWSITSNPTTADSKTTDGIGTGAFTSSMTGLTPGQSYFVRAYATNAIGTAYGLEQAFTTLIDVTFNVDMFTAPGFIPGTDLVYLAGSFPTWIEPGTPGSILMTQVDSTLVYTTTLALTAGNYAYKYFKNAGWTNGEYQSGADRSIVVSGTQTQNDTWGGNINWANLQWPGNGTIDEGGTFDVYAQAYINQGVTGVTGGALGLQTWIGVSTTNTDPSTWTTWIPAPYDSPQGNNDQFKANIGTALTAGTYYYASRFQLTTGAYVYGGFYNENNNNGGFWDGTTNISGVLTVNEVVTSKTLNLTAYLQGFWNGTGMNQAQDVDIDFNVWNKWTGTTVDTLSVYLADAASPYDLVFQAHTVNISTDGSMTITVPAAFSGSYYIALVHRSSIETWSADPVSFSGSTITYNFSTAASQAFGSNQIDLLGDGSVWGLFGGELYSSGGVLPADGYIDINDVNAIYNENVNASFGYMLEDITGDGFVDINDFNMVYNNNVNAVGLNTPIFPMKRPRNGKN